MRKKLIGIGLAIITLLAGSGITYAQSENNKKAPATELTKGNKKNKKEKKSHKAPNSPKVGIAERSNFNPFDGVQLTEDQQQKLQLLRKGLGPVMPKEKQKKEKLTDEQKKQLKAEMKAKKAEAKKNYLKGVKEILTPDQYVIFLENVYLNAPEQTKGEFPKGKKK